MNIINLSDLNPNWCWLKSEFGDSQDNWQHISSQSIGVPSFIPKKDSIKRAIAAWRATKLAGKAPTILVSHGPRPAYYGASFARSNCPQTPHLVYSFNFTQLPTGNQHKMMVKAYQQPSRFTSYSTLERQLYADYFDIPIEKIDMLHWAVHKPKLDLNSQAIETGAYICALGSQARDYKTLFAAMQKLPQIKLVVVASKESVEGLTVPSNVKVHTNIPLANAQNILAHSLFTVLPLNSSTVPCGHVTIVSAMFHQKAIVVTNSAGVHDYIQDGQTGLFVNPQDANDLAQKIAELWDDSAKKQRLSQTALNFADTHCTEKTAVEYFQQLLNQVKSNQPL